MARHVESCGFVYICFSLDLFCIRVIESSFMFLTSSVSALRSHKRGLSLRIPLTVFRFAAIRPAAAFGWELAPESIYRSPYIPRPAGACLQTEAAGNWDGSPKAECAVAGRLFFWLRLHK